MKRFNSEHISCIASILWAQTGGDPDKAVLRAINLQRIADEKCKTLNTASELEEVRENARKDFHDEGNATNHMRSECSKQRCGLDPVV